MYNCIGAIDDTYMQACVVCSFDMQFMFIWVRWEGSAYDNQKFLKAIANPHIKFPKPPEGINEQKYVMFVIF
jgi:hypothetical protein